jgi:pyruvate kinase
MALRNHIGGPGERLIILAGIPFGTAGTTNVMHVAQLVGDELDDYSGV